MAAGFKFGVTLKAFRGVESAVTVVETPVFFLGGGGGVGCEISLNDIIGR